MKKILVFVTFFTIFLTFSGSIGVKASPFVPTDVNLSINYTEKELYIDGSTIDTYLLKFYTDTNFTFMPLNLMYQYIDNELATDLLYTMPYDLTQNWEFFQDGFQITQGDNIHFIWFDYSSSGPSSSYMKILSDDFTVIESVSMDNLTATSRFLNDVDTDCPECINYYNDGFADGQVSGKNSIVVYGSQAFGYALIDSYDYNEGYDDGYDVGLAETTSQATINFYNGFENWIVPSIIAVMFGGFIIYVIKGKRN